MTGEEPRGTKLRLGMVNMGSVVGKAKGQMEDM